MADTNILQFNPSAINQETDDEYLADSQRLGGAPNGAEFPSKLGNKVFYSLSTVARALCLSLAAKGFSTSDANIAVLTTVFANFLTTADVQAPLQVQGFSPTPAFDTQAFSGFQITLTGNITSSTASGVQPGRSVIFCWIQDATGGRTVTYPAGSVGGIQPDPAPNSVNFIAFRADSSGVLRAISPLVSNNGIFTTAINGTTLTLSGAISALSLALSGAISAASGVISGLLNVGSFQISGTAPVGSHLIGDGTSFSVKTLIKTDVGPTGSNARSFGTVYQNTSSAEMRVSVVGSAGSGGGSFQSLVGSSNPPTMVCSDQARVPAASSDPVEKVCMFFEVPVGEYYKVGNFGLTLTNWIEWTYV